MAAATKPASPPPASPPAGRTSAATPAGSNDRLMSLDALRGFDMCWILGLDAIIRTGSRRLAAASWCPDALKGPLESVQIQLSHVDWEGIRFYDVIFPLFLFLSGVSMAISVGRRQKRDGTFKAARHLVTRALLICVVGIIYSGGLSGVTWVNKAGEFAGSIDSIRLLGVLQRIGIASAAAGLLSLWLGTRGLVVALLTILGAYWAMLTYIPVPGIGAGNYAADMNFANYIDKLWLPGRKYPKGSFHDPEGILSTLPAVGTAILGILSGRWLFGPAAPLKKTIVLFGAGVLVAAVGFVWHMNPLQAGWFPTFPIIKKIWTSSFVLAAGGFSMMALAIFYGVIDGVGIRKWAAPFVWVGANPIALYLASGMGAFRTVSNRLTGTVPAPYDWIMPLVAFLLMITTARFLYKRGIFFRL